MADKPNPNRRPRPASVSSGATAGRPTTASAWKKKTVEGTPLRVPSGNTCLARAPGLETFIRQGMIPNGLMPIITDAMKKGKAPTQDDLNMDNPEMINEVMSLFDDVTVYCVIEPAVAPQPYDDQDELIPLGDSRRDPDTLYVDEVEFEDKIFIFQWAVGGTADFEKFRQELA